MILSRAGMAINMTAQETGTPSLPPHPPHLSSTNDVKITPVNGKGKEKAIYRKPWADEPWPLIEPLSRSIRITHPAHHIAEEISHTHNAMLRGLNTLYLQAPFIRDPIDVSDFLFLAQAWSGWVFDYHELKESAMIPDFEAVLGLERGVLGGRDDNSSTRSSEEAGVEGDFNNDTNGDKLGEQEEYVETQPTPQDLPALLQDLHSYAIKTHPQPLSYSPSTFRALLVTLASALVPHLHNQIGTILHMEELSSSPPYNTSTPSLPSMPSLPSLSPSPAPSQPSTINSTSTPLSTTPSAQSKSTIETTEAPATATATAIPQPPPPSRPPPLPPLPQFSTPPITPSLQPKLAPSPRASTLTQIHLTAESAFSAKMNRYTIPPMAIRLRDASHDGGARLSVPAIHAIADRLSPRHAGAWRFLPCDIWGRRRGLEFLGDEGGYGEDGDGE